MKRTLIAFGMIVALVASTFAGCGSKRTTTPISGNSGNKPTTGESSYLSWVGRFELEKVEVMGNVIVKKDFPEFHYHTNQHITLNKDGTGKLAISTNSTIIPLETKDITYTYDALYQNGEIFWTDDLYEKQEIEFTLVDGVLQFEVQGGIFTFKK